MTTKDPIYYKRLLESIEMSDDDEDSEEIKLARWAEVRKSLMVDPFNIAEISMPVYRVPKERLLHLRHLDDYFPEGMDGGYLILFDRHDREYYMVAGIKDGRAYHYRSNFMGPRDMRDMARSMLTSDESINEAIGDDDEEDDQHGINLMKAFYRFNKIGKSIGGTWYSVSMDDFMNEKNLKPYFSKPYIEQNSMQGDKEAYILFDEDLDPQKAHAQSVKLMIVVGEDGILYSDLGVGKRIGDDLIKILQGFIDLTGVDQMSPRGDGILRFYVIRDGRVLNGWTVIHEFKEPGIKSHPHMDIYRVDRKYHYLIPHLYGVQVPEGVDTVYAVQVVDRDVGVAFIKDGTAIDWSSGGKISYEEMRGVSKALAARSASAIRRTKPS